MYMSAEEERKGRGRKEESEKDLEVSEVLVNGAKPHSEFRAARCVDGVKKVSLVEAA